MRNVCICKTFFIQLFNFKYVLEDILRYVSVYILHFYFKLKHIWLFNMHRKIVKQIEIEDNVCLRNQFKSDLHTSHKVLEKIFSLQ